MIALVLSKTIAFAASSRSFQVVCMAALYFLFAPFLPLWVDRALLAISLSLKEAMLWILPLSVLFFIASTIRSFERKAPFFLLALLGFEVLSNSASVWYAYGSAYLSSAPSSFSEISSSEPGALVPLWSPFFPRPFWWSPGKGTLAGIFLGLSAAFLPSVFSSSVEAGKKAAQKVLTRIFSPLIPVFILGFLAKMRFSSVLPKLWAHYAHLFFWLVAALALYLCLLFVLASLGTGKSWAASLKNLLPAGGLALTTGCSLSTMPVTIEGTAKNLRYPDLAKAVIPATTNIQQTGDCFINAFLCFLLYTHFHGTFPPLSVWIPFSIAFTAARFATAAVLGGAIFVMLPLYEAYLGFDGEMAALILAFNVLLDPLVTSANVLGNGALCQIFERLLIRLRIVV